MKLAFAGLWIAHSTMLSMNLIITKVQSHSLQIKIFSILNIMAYYMVFYGFKHSGKLGTMVL